MSGRRTDLPAMDSCNACGKCCGPASATPVEAKRIRHYLRDTGESWQIPDAGDPARCGFLRANGDGSYRCAVYPVRPWVCRAYGVVIQLACPFFPEEARVDFPADRAVGLGRLGLSLLGSYFEPGYMERLQAGPNPYLRLIEL